MGSLEVLLVEDNPDHAELTKRSLETQDDPNRIHWVKDGQEALDFLFQNGGHTKAPRPDLILLDIKLPKITGIEVLEKIKKDHNLKVIPVVMLTTSDRDEEAMGCYRAGANSFIIKPIKFGEFSEKIKSMKVYWFKTNKGPHG